MANNALRNKWLWKRKYQTTRLSSLVWLWLAAVVAAVATVANAVGIPFRAQCVMENECMVTFWRIANWFSWPVKLSVKYPTSRYILLYPIHYTCDSHTRTLNWRWLENMNIIFLLVDIVTVIILCCNDVFNWVSARNLWHTGKGKRSKANGDHRLKIVDSICRCSVAMPCSVLDSSAPQPDPISTQRIAQSPHLSRTTLIPIYDCDIE